MSALKSLGLLALPDWLGAGATTGTGARTGSRAAGSGREKLSGAPRCAASPSAPVRAGSLGRAQLAAPLGGRVLPNWRPLASTSFL